MRAKFSSWKTICLFFPCAARPFLNYSAFARYFVLIGLWLITTHLRMDFHPLSINIFPEFPLFINLKPSLEHTVSAIKIEISCCIWFTNLVGMTSISLRFIPPFSAVLAGDHLLVVSLSYLSRCASFVTCYHFPYSCGLIKVVYRLYIGF